MSVIKVTGASGEIPVKRFNFPDGQVHVQVGPYSDKYDDVLEIRTAIIDGNDLLATLLTVDALRSAGASKIDLFITYMLAARMDRRIAAGQPFTLEVVAKVLTLGNFRKITVLDPHSPVTCQRLGAEGILPIKSVKEVLRILDWQPDQDVGLVAPDAGSVERVTSYAYACGGDKGSFRITKCLKHRDSQTGALSGFVLANPEERVPERVLICDDILDAGGTFSGVAKLLKDAGAKQVNLYITHGIFSKGDRIANIDRIFTTDSYKHASLYPEECMTLVSF